MIIQLTDEIPKPLLEAALHIFDRLNRAGFESYLVGGCVRDILIGSEVHEIDMTTNCLPSESMKLFPGAIPVGIEFGTIIVRVQKISVELTTFRHDFDYEDGRRPGKITFGKSLKDDVLRRDFTINGLAIEPRSGKLIDYVEGLQDIKELRLRTIGNPITRFKEDGLRSVRGCRFASRLGLKVDKSTFQAMAQMLPVTEKISRERFYEEWRKTLFDPNRFKFWVYLQDSGILPLFIKFDYAFNSTHIEKYLSFKKVNSMGSYAALLFQALKLNQDEINVVLKHLKFSNKEIGIVIELLKFTSADLNSEYDLRLALSAVSKANREILRKYVYEHPYLSRKTKSIIKQYRNKELSLSIKELTISGYDLKAIIPGIEGTRIGSILKEIHEENLRGVLKNNKTELINYVLERIKQ